MHMKMPRWIQKTNGDRHKPPNTTAPKEIEDVERDAYCLFCGERHELHPLDLPYYTVRTLCDGTHIRP